MNILKHFIMMTFSFIMITACGTTSVYTADTSSSATGYHRNEYNHKHGNAPPVPDQKQLPPQK